MDTYSRLIDDIGGDAVDGLSFEARTTFFSSITGLRPPLRPRAWGTQYGLSCAAQALDNTVYVASANQLGDYPEARFDAPGGVYGPDGGRVSEATGALSAGKIDLGFPERWRSSFGSTLLRAPVTPGPPTLSQEAARP